jgi:phosphomannomutase
MQQQFDWLQLQNGSDIRGVAMEGVEGETVNLTTERVALLGEAFVRWIRANTGKETLRIAVGMDSRLTGPAFIEALERHLVKFQVDVLNCGLASTPAMFMSTILPDFKADGAIMLTASHLPFNRNGMKFFTSKGGLEKSDITGLLRLAANPSKPEGKSKGQTHITNIISVYSSFLVEKARQEINDADNYKKPLTGFNIVVDAGNGAGGFYANRVLKNLGADVTGSQYLEPDGRFPNHVPNPEDHEAMNSICQAVRACDADLGIIFDTDVDRSAIVDFQGRAINRNELIALSSAIILSEHPGSTIVTDSITSDGLAWFITDHLKGRHHRFKRGYKNVINEAIRLNSEGEDCWLAIETSGHAALRENHFLDDGAYLATRIIIEMAKIRKRGGKLTDLIAPLPVPAGSREYRIKITDPDFVAKGNEVIEKLGQYAATMHGWRVVPDNYEGVRFACTNESEKGWFLLRMSLHDPVLPLNVESDVIGGVDLISSKLHTFFASIEGINCKGIF